MIRTVGVEEELLLVDARTGEPRSVGSQVLRIAARRASAEHLGEGDGSLVAEFQDQQVETNTPPETDLGALEADVLAWRARAREAAAECGALILPSGTTPIPVRRERTAEASRYAEISERFGMTATEELTCGFHVHVGVDSDDEAIGAQDRIRAWLPVLLALSANSPFWHGSDTRYQSYRSQVMVRWPMQGPPDRYGSAEAYRARLAEVLATGVPIDEGMVYADSRPSLRFPTLEIRIADVCLDPRDALVIAALGRALISTAARQWHDGVEADDVSVAILRLATWRAARYGITGDLLDPRTHRPEHARAVLEGLLEHVADALNEAGDTARVEEGIERLFSSGTGATRQRAMLEREGSLERAVVRLASLATDR